MDMDWIKGIQRAIDYTEAHLTEEIDYDAVAKEAYSSAFHFQRVFSIMCGYTLGDYIRMRRLSLAADELRGSDEKVIDIALKYGYETPESFTKAFSRFHGVTPSQVRDGAAGKVFLPLTIKLSVQGGSQMAVKIAPMFPFKVIGFQKIFDNETAYAEIPKFWNETCEKYANRVYAGNAPSNPYEQALVDNCIGEYGVCIDDIGGGKFRYLIAGKYTGGAVPDGMVVYEFPRNEWAVFDCIGPNPQTLQSVNTRIFSEWLPGNPDYELSGNATVEWYDCVNGEMTDPDYHSAIWVPVKRKKQAN